MNGIDSLIADGTLRELIAASRPGETYHAGERGVQCASDAAEGVGKIRSIHDAFKAAAPEGGRVSLWITRSTSGETTMGEIVLDTGQDTPAVIWQIGEDAAPRLDYGSPRTVTFTSASERLEVTADPCSLLGMVDHPRSGEAEAIVRALGYQPSMDLKGDLTVRFKDLELEAADA